MKTFYRKRLNPVHNYISLSILIGYYHVIYIYIYYKRINIILVTFDYYLHFELKKEKFVLKIRCVTVSNEHYSQKATPNFVNNNNNIVKNGILKKKICKISFSFVHVESVR